MSSKLPPHWRLLSAWFPALLGVAAILCESTDYFSAEKTSGPLRVIWALLFGAVSNRRWAEIHFILRKAGHMLGYGALSVLFFRAWYLTLSLKRRLAGLLPLSSALALACTLLMAAFDELHQTYIPSRTGTLHDVQLDMLGALMMQLVLALVLLMVRARRPAPGL